MVIDQGDDQSQVRGAQLRCDLCDALAYLRAVPALQAVAVRGKDANDPAPKPASIGKVLVDVAEVGMEQHAVHVQQQKAVVERIRGRDARHTQSARVGRGVLVGAGDGHQAPEHQNSADHKPDSPSCLACPRLRDVWLHCCSHESTGTWHSRV